MGYLASVSSKFAMHTDECIEAHLGRAALLPEANPEILRKSAVEMFVVHEQIMALL